MQDRLVSLLIFSIVLSGLIDIGYSKRTFDVLNYRAVGDGEADDSEAFVNAWKALCGADEVGDAPTLVIPKGKTFLLQPIEFEGPCRPKRVHIQVLGNVVAPKTVDAWKECPSSNTWLQFTNVANLILDGSGTINGQGSPWWSNSIANQYISFINVNEKSCERPRALQFNRCDNLRLSGLTHVNSPKAHIGINHCINVDVSHLTIIAPAESPNTDGIDISNSINVNIHDSFIGTGDDCIAINSGSSNINITNIACGPGHGISVGSLGKNGAHETVENVYVRDCSFNGTQNGARIKTWQGGSGYAKNIVFEKITLVAAKNPIIIDQFYCDAKAKISCDNHMTSAVTVSEVRYFAFEGTSGSEEAITLNCNQIHGCQNIVMEEIHITSAVPSKKIYASCSHAKGTCNDSTVPVSCLDK
ncbi:hypothetical protein C1H46_026020 [Malus baccata]|uniref:endo-polygalacturonase n=1 Tax=Malus baccata TaxID=106549 RepID=A0A540LPK1_MALBA|nr:hypothetical protein C1H46_026020 [Malus baccata]